MMNELIQKVAESGLSSAMYGWVNAVAASIALLYCLWHGRKLGVPLWKMAIILAVVYCGSGPVGNLIWSGVEYLREIQFLGITKTVNSIVRLFVFFPLLAIIPALVLRVKCSLACDAIVMYPLLRSCFAQLACIFPGCCKGYVWEHGIYNIKTHSYHFPIQIVETVLTLCIFIYLLIVLKNKRYVSDGTLYPQMMVFYGVMRFACELLRDNEKIFLGISAIAFHALFMIIVGAVWLYLLSRRKEKINGDSIQTDQA